MTCFLEDLGLLNCDEGGGYHQRWHAQVLVRIDIKLRQDSLLLRSWSRLLPDSYFVVLERSHAIGL